MDLNYKWARDNLYSKDRYLFNFINDMLNKTAPMFRWENLPKEIPSRVLERFLTESGYCIFTEHSGRFVILQGGLGGELNEYYEPTKCTVANPYLKLNKEYTLNDDCVLIRNDARMIGLLPTLAKYAVLCGDCEISINMITNILRSQLVISASDDKTKESAELYLKRLADGDFSVIGSQAFLDGVKVQSPNSSGNYITQFIELNQYLRATAFNEIGLDANYNMKRERLTENEIDLNASILLPLSENMLAERKAACELINEKYGLNVQVDLSSVWKLRQETMDKATETESTESETDKAENETETVKAESETDKAENETDKAESETETDKAENGTDKKDGE